MQGEIVREFGMGMCTLSYLKLITNKDHCIAHETMLSVTWQLAWAGSLGKNGYLYMYG